MDQLKLIRRMIPTVAFPPSPAFSVEPLTAGRLLSMPEWTGQFRLLMRIATRRTHTTVPLRARTEAHLLRTAQHRRTDMATQFLWWTRPETSVKPGSMDSTE